MATLAAWPTRARTAAEDPAREAGRLPVPRRPGRGPLRRQGEVAAPARALVLPVGRRRAAASPTSRARIADLEVIVTRQRGGGAPPRADARQAPPAAVQRPAARRQVVPVHRRHGRGRLPARHVHARAPPAWRRLLRPVREREEGARDARRAQPRLPLPARARGRSRAATRASRASITTSTGAWRPASATCRRRTTRELIDGVVQFLSGDTKSIQRELEQQMLTPPRSSASRTRPATATGSSPCGTWPSGRPRNGASSGRST